MRPIVPAWLVLAVAGAAITGCSFDSSEDLSKSVDASQFRIETDRDVYVPNEEGMLEIGYTLINGTEQTIYITDATGHLRGEIYKQIGNRWVFATGYGVPDVLRSPIELRSGESHSHVLRLPVPNEGRGTWKIEAAEIQGTFRVRETVYASWDADRQTGELLPEEFLVSQPFEIRR